jgi:hypothetical protein
MDETGSEKPNYRLFGGAAVLLILAVALGFFLGQYRKPAVATEYIGDAARAIDCSSPTGKTERMPTTKLYFEYNSTDNDTGIHGAFDTTSFAELCVYDPNGKQILAVKPQGKLKELTMAGIFFESQEPKHSEISIEEHMQNFPEGLYAIKGVTHDGVGLTGAATLSHAVPAPARILAPKEQEIVAVDDLAVRWSPVTRTTTDAPVTISGYEVIVTKENHEDPHGFSQPIYDVHVGPSVTSLRVPKEFFEPKTDYELGILALETSGNQTITVSFFSVTD